MSKTGLSQRAAIIALALSTVATRTHAQGSRATGDAPFDSAFFAWEAGHYPEALQRLERLLSGRNAAAYRIPAALLTGELYSTSELKRDGRMARWSPDGKYVAYDGGTGSAVITHVIQMGVPTPGEVVAIKGAGKVLGNGTIAWIDVPDGQNRAMAVIVIRDLATGTERRVPGLQANSVVYAPDGTLYFLAGAAGAVQLYRLEGERGVAVTNGGGTKAGPVWLAGGQVLHGIDAQSFGMTANGTTTPIAGTLVSVAGDRRSFAYITRDGTQYRLTVAKPDGASLRSFTVPYAVSTPRLSSDGSRVAYQGMPREDWEIYVADVAETGQTSTGTRVTRDIQHDILPQFIDNDHLLIITGEARHRRSAIYDVRTGARTRLFHNNTIRTVAPEYEWALSPDGGRVLIVAERDGDTVSPERGVYVTDLTREVTTEDVLGRVRAMLVAENDLRARGRAMFAPIASRVAPAVADVSRDRIFTYARDLFEFESKYITQPGNAKAIEYIAAKLRSWGYEPELQYFEVAGRNGASGARTANVVARLRGTMDRDATYVVSSHFDSVLAGAGADDDTSGTTALLEAARVMAKRPQARTIEFAFFTGEEAGLLGSREFVRRAVAEKKKIVGALNNDMVGFANDQRLDNTIRYSNSGIRDLQHGAALQFSNLITYDAKYYKSTDAQAYYDAYGDIVGGIGSYPILSSPHYHQSHDVLETINQQLVTEVSKTTVATLMLLTASPSRLTGLAAATSGGGTQVTWNAAAESDVRTFRVEWGAPGAAARGRAQVTGRAATSFTSPAIRAGDEVRVKPVNAAGMDAWDWARVIVK